MKYLVLALLTVSAAHAQHKFDLGVTAGENFTSYRGRTDAHATANFSLGIYSAIKLGDRLSLQSNLLFKYNGGASQMRISLPGGPGPYDSTHVKRSVNYITINGILFFHCSSRITLGIGPQFMIRTGANDRYTSTNGIPDLKIDSGSRLHKYDAGMVLALDYYIMKPNLTVGLHNYYGFMEVQKDVDGVKNLIIQLRVGMPIFSW